MSRVDGLLALDKAVNTASDIGKALSNEKITTAEKISNTASLVSDFVGYFSDYMMQ